MGPLSYSRRARPRDAVRCASATERLVRFGYARRAGDLFWATSVCATVPGRTLRQSALNLSRSRALNYSQRMCSWEPHCLTAPTASPPTRTVASHATRS